MRNPILAFAAAVLFSVGILAPSAQAQSGDYSEQQLDSMLAPIALYPDELLSQVLIAATYPDDVADAADFLDRQPSLSGDALAAAVSQEPWDDSVKSLIQFPSVIAMLNDQPDWADALGYAFVNQQGDVMAAVQRLRMQARDAGYLTSNNEQQVLVRDNYIYIEPYRPQFYHVPYYDPLVVYGSWPYPDYPPYYWAPPPRYRPPGYSLANGIFFGIGVGIVASIFHPARPDWHHHHVVIVGGHRPGTIWHHRPRPPRPARPGRPPRPGLPTTKPILKPPAHRPPSHGVRPPRPGKPARPGVPGVRPPHPSPGRPTTGKPGGPAIQPPRPQHPGRPEIRPPQRPTPPAANKPAVKPALPARPATRPSLPANPRPAVRPAPAKPVPAKPAAPQSRPNVQRPTPHAQRQEKRSPSKPQQRRRDQGQ